jgi:small subunit ribosomal protein S2
MVASLVNQPQGANLKSLLEAGVHFGHQKNRWNPKMKPYIFTERNGIHIIDLQQTVPLLERAFALITAITSRGQSILFVGTKKQAQDIIRREAERSGQFYVNRRWLGGTLTNFVTIKSRLNHLKQLQSEAASGQLDYLPKQEAADRLKELERLERTLGGMRDMTRLPAAIFVIDPKREHLAIHEASRLGIPIIAMVDTNSDPDPIDYPIPANDDAIRAIRLIAAGIADAAILGRTERESVHADDAGLFDGQADSAPVAVELEPASESPREADQAVAVTS